MPWHNVTPKEEIIRFVLLARTDRFTIADRATQRRSGQARGGVFLRGGLLGRPNNITPPSLAPNGGRALQGSIVLGKPTDSCE